MALPDLINVLTTLMPDVSTLITNIYIYIYIYIYVYIGVAVESWLWEQVELMAW